jgi:hypothetical protein
MASPSNDLPALRARAVDLERRVGRKISRIKSKTGALVAGTEFDPRKAKGAAATMRTRDAQAYIRRLENTLSRSTQFVAGVRGAPLPRAAFNEYKATEAKLIGVRKAEIGKFADERLPGPGTETVGQRQAKIRGPHPTAMNMAYIPQEREPFNIKDAAALKKLTAANKRRVNKRFSQKEHKRAREEFAQMVAVFNDPTLSASVSGMSKNQFDMMWNLTRFADAMSTAYHHIRAKYSAKQQMPESVMQDQISEAKSIIEWVKKLKI